MSYLTVILALFVVAVLCLLVFDLLAVLLSYSIFWYEYSNQHPASYDQRFNRRSLTLCSSLIFGEFFFNLITLTALPIGLFKSQSQSLKRGVTPTLLLNGLFANQACWLWFKRQLKSHGIDNVVTMNLSCWHSEEVLTELLAKRVDELRHQLGVQKVNLVGHSFGGIVARNYVQLRGGENKVERLVCLGSPHAGSKLAPFSFSPLGKLLIPGSSFLQKLNTETARTAIPTTVIYTRKDNMVLPNNNCQLPWGEHIALDGMGHTSLIYRAEAIKATATALKGINNDT